jgi:hypothetical protein
MKGKVNWLRRKRGTRNQIGKSFPVASKGTLPKLQNMNMKRRNTAPSLQEDMVLSYLKQGMNTTQILKLLEERYPGRFTYDGLLKILKKLEADGKIKLAYKSGV